MTPPDIAPTDVSPAPEVLGGPAGVVSRPAHPDDVAITFRREGVLQEWTYHRVRQRVRRLTWALAALGVRPGDRVALLAHTRAEWTLADLAALRAGAVVVPVYATSSPEEVAHVLADSGARVAICEDAVQVAKVHAARPVCPELRTLTTIDPAPGVPCLATLEARAPADPPDEPSPVAPDDPATIVYTSGSTGPPKGCVLTHANLSATVAMYERALRLEGRLVVFAFLPLAHVLARITQFVALDLGGTLAFWSGQPDRLLEDLREARPTHLPVVPRVLEKVHQGALAQARGPIRRRVLATAVAVGHRAREAERCGESAPASRLLHAIADRAVLRRVRGLFGDRLELVLCGAAPVGVDVLTFLDACGVLVLEGYGLTESTAAATLNTPDAVRFDTVGRPLPGTEVRVGDRGEVLLRGPQVFAGYAGRARETTETFRDGWLRTGDLGALDADGFLRITGRLKELIVTSGGKNVSPAAVETVLRGIRWVSQAVVHGDRRPYLVALLTLDPEQLPALAAETGLATDTVPATAARAPAVRELLRREVARTNGRLARPAQVRRFAVLDRDLTTEAGELTPTRKLRRPVVTERYADRLEALYGEDGSGTSVP